jgi:uncharacterized membrane protein
MDILNFLGRLHPLVVHLPIGFLLIAFLLEWFKREKETKARSITIIFILFCGALSAIGVALFGWLLANDGGFDEDILFWHRWLGIGTAILATIAWWAKIKTQLKVYKYVLWGMVFLLLATGHFGGSLTHGSDYLLKPLLGNKDEITMKLPSQPDSIKVYKHLIQPILEQKCYGCHNAEKKKGGLDLTSWEGITLGGESGNTIEDGIWTNEMFKRVTLSQNSKKFMPPKGNPLKYSEITLLKWWIENGSDPDFSVIQHKISEETQNILMREYQIDSSPKSFVERTQVPPLREAQFSRLLAQGWKVQTLGETNYLLEVTSIRSDSMPKTNMDNLLAVKGHITWLNLRKTEITGKDLATISQPITFAITKQWCYR